MQKFTGSHNKFTHSNTVLVVVVVLYCYLVNRNSTYLHEHVPGVVQPGIISILLLLYHLYLTCRILLAADLVLAELTLLTGLELAYACACVRSYIMGQTLPVEVPISAHQIILTHQQFWLLFCIVWLIDRDGWNND